MDIQTMLTDDFTQKVIREFGIAGESDEAKAYLLAQLGDNIAGRVLLETQKMLPEGKRAEFNALVDGSPDALVAFLQPYIPDFSQFVQTEAQKEIERTKEYMLEETEMAVTGGGQ